MTFDLCPVQTHPDFPKKPLTPYFRFFMEKRAKYAKIHPEMSNLDLTKILSKKYKELPDKKKVWTRTCTKTSGADLTSFVNRTVCFFLQQKYICEFQQEKEDFERNMARFK